MVAEKEGNRIKRIDLVNEGSGNRVGTESGEKNLQVIRCGHNKTIPPFFSDTVFESLMQ